MARKELPTDVEIIEAFGDGTLVEWIFTGFGHLDPLQMESLIATCADLHNSGAIDVIRLISPEVLAQIEPTRFFVGQQFYSDIIPRLNSPAEVLMEAVLALVEQGGNDSAANEPNRAFRNWCAVDVSRSREVIRLARDGVPEGAKLVTFALEAWNLAEEAMDLTGHRSLEIQLSAITALGRMTIDDEDTARETLRRLFGLLKGHRDEEFLCNVLVAALSISRKFKSTVLHALEITRRVTKIGGSTVQSCCAHALSRHGEGLSGEIAGVLLEALLNIDVSSKSTIRQLDNALRHLVDSEHRNRALEFLHRLMTNAGGALGPSQFESLGNRLKHEPKDRLWPTLISWLFSGEQALCEWLPLLVMAHSGADEPQEISQHVLELGGREKFFLARKIIGYLFLQPVTCVSMLISILRTCDGEAADNIANLLFEPMLLNYGGAAREYLEALPPSDPVHPWIQDALGKADALAAEFAPRDAIRELHPSEHERQITHQLMADEMAASLKKAQSESVLLSLVSRSVVLYGRRSLSYVDVPGQARQPFEVDLRPHSVSFELPRLQMVDPVRLDYMLMVFRGEAFTP